MITCPECFCELPEVDAGVKMLHGEIARLQRDLRMATELLGQSIVSVGGQVRIERHLYPPEIALSRRFDVVNQQDVYEARVLGP